MTAWWEGPLFGFDLEATGVDPLADVPVSYCLVKLGNGKPPGSVYRLVNPERDIPPESTKVHGITDAMVRGEIALETPVETLTEAVGYCLDALTAASRSDIPIVVMNAPYDCTMINRLSWELYIPRVASNYPEFGLVPRPVLDLMVLDKQIDPYRLTKDIGGRTLGNICAHYGVKHSGAHNAVQDTLAACRAVWKIGKLSKASNVDLHHWYEQRRDSYSPPRGDYRGSTPWLHQQQALHQIGDMTLGELHAAQTLWRYEQASHLQAYKRKTDPEVTIDFRWPVIPCGLEPEVPGD